MPSKNDVCIIRKPDLILRLRMFFGDNLGNLLRGTCGNS